MALKLYLFSLFSILVLSLFLWIVLVLDVNPYQAPFWIILLFYFTFFAIFSCIFALFGFYFKRWIANNQVVFASLLPTLRQSALLSLVITSCLFFWQIKVLNWWITAMLITAVFILEIFSRTKQTKLRQSR